MEIRRTAIVRDFAAGDGGLVRFGLVWEGDWRVREGEGEGEEGERGTFLSHCGGEVG